MFVKLGKKFVNTDFVKEYEEISVGGRPALAITFKSDEVVKYPCEYSEMNEMRAQILPAPEGYFCVDLDGDGELCRSPIIAFRYYGDGSDLMPISMYYPTDGGILTPEGKVVVPEIEIFDSLEHFIENRRASRRG
jgi:hypothetical protein